MTKLHRFAAVAAFAVILGVAGQVSAAEIEPNKIQQRAKGELQDGGAKITRLAYVSSKSHTKTSYVEGSVFRDDSFSLTYKFTYRDNDNDPQAYTLRFLYSKTGKLTDVETVDHSSFWEPFNALKIAGALADGIAKELGK